MCTSCFKTTHENSDLKTNNARYNTTQSPEPEFVFNSSLNILYGDDSDLKPLENKIKITESKRMTFKMLTNVSPDKSMCTQNIPMRIWILIDGNPVEFSIKDNNYQIYNDVSTDAFVDQITDVTFNVSKKNKIITVLCVFFPEDIPERGLGSYSGEISYTIINSECPLINNSYKNYSENYVVVEAKDDNFGIDIGQLTVKDNNNKVVENHFYEDISLKDKEKKLYFKFNNGNKTSLPYFVMILCDGHMIDIFNNKYIYTVDCLNGSRTFQYCISSEFIPDSGLHTFQAIATPANVTEDFTSYSTPKIRVQLS